MNYSLSYPALTGEVVTEGHARHCVEHGHATHTVDGVASPICPRCGEGAKGAPMNDTIGTETTTGEVLLVELDEENREIRFLDDNDHIIRAYAFATFATITGALAIDADTIIDAATVAGLQQWARI